MLTHGRRRIPVDPLAVENAIAGHRPQLLPSERRLAVAELRRRGMSCTAIAAHLGCCVRTAERHSAAISAAEREAAR